jgi:ribosomal protein L3
MPAILARKIGMTQRFLEDGRVERVTVLEAGPCPVTAIRTFERDGYEAVQLAFGACKEKVLTRAELGHLKKASPARSSATTSRAGPRPTVPTTTGHPARSAPRRGRPA